jgi:hypothetical protein
LLSLEAGKFFIIYYSFILTFTLPDCPVGVSTTGPVNTCSDLDWPMSMASHLWYLTNPLSSVGDALHEFGLACFCPSGISCSGYFDRSTDIEQLVDPSSHTGNRLDSRLGWLVAVAGWATDTWLTMPGTE